MENVIERKVKLLNSDPTFTSLLRRLNEVVEKINLGGVEKREELEALEDEQWDIVFQIRDILYKMFPQGFWSGYNDNFVVLHQGLRYELSFDFEEGKVEIARKW